MKRALITTLILIVVAAVGMIGYYTVTTLPESIVFESKEMEGTFSFDNTYQYQKNFQLVRRDLYDLTQFLKDQTYSVTLKSIEFDEANDLLIQLGGIDPYFNAVLIFKADGRSYLTYDSIKYTFETSDDLLKWVTEKNALYREASLSTEPAVTLTTFVKLHREKDGEYQYSLTSTSPDESVRYLEINHYSEFGDTINVYGRYPLSYVRDHIDHRSIRLDTQYVSGTQTEALTERKIILRGEYLKDLKAYPFQAIYDISDLSN